MCSLFITIKMSCLGEGQVKGLCALFVPPPFQRKGAGGHGNRGCPSKRPCVRPSVVPSVRHSVCPVKVFFRMCLCARRLHFLMAWRGGTLDTLVAIFLLYNTKHLGPPDGVHIISEVVCLGVS